MSDQPFVPIDFAVPDGLRAGEFRFGCVYIYPPRGDGPGGTGTGRYAVVRSWVRADHAALDPVLYHVVLGWLERDWPFRSIEYAPRT